MRDLILHVKLMDSQKTHWKLICSIQLNYILCIQITTLYFIKTVSNRFFFFFHSYDRMQQLSHGVCLSLAWQFWRFCLFLSPACVIRMECSRTKLFSILCWFFLFRLMGKKTCIQFHTKYRNLGHRRRRFHRSIMCYC